MSQPTQKTPSPIFIALGLLIASGMVGGAYRLQRVGRLNAHAAQARASLEKGDAIEALLILKPMLARYPEHPALAKLCENIIRSRISRALEKKQTAIPDPWLKEQMNEIPAVKASVRKLLDASLPGSAEEKVLANYFPK